MRSDVPQRVRIVARLRHFGTLAREILNVHTAGARYAPMEGLRAYAAILVFIVHYTAEYAGRIRRLDLDALSFEKIDRGWDLFMWYCFRSHYGVEIFFLLSGFLIFRMAARQRFYFTRFIRNRFARIYPAFLLSLLLVIAYRMSTHKFVFDPVQFAGNLAFLNGFPELNVIPYNTPTWSLAFEFLFYLLFPLSLLAVIGRTNATPPKIAAMTALIWIVLLFPNPYYARFLMFFGGAYMAAHSDDALRKHAGRLSDWMAVSAYVVAGALFSLDLDLRVFVPVFLIATYLVVLRIMFGDGWLRRFFSTTPLRMLGNLSYSFYLVHILVIEVLIWRVGYLFNWLLRIPHAGGWLYIAASFIVTFAASTAIAIGLFLLAERPYLTRERRPEHAA